MGKTKTSNARAKSSEISPIDFMVPSKLKPGVKVTRHEPGKRLRDRKFIAAAVWQCLIENDFGALKKIIRAHYEAINTNAALKKAGMSSRTFYHATGPRGNPSIATLGKMLRGMKLEHSINTDE